MADNPTVDNGGLTDYVVATDDDGVAQHQYVKVEFGADNTQTKVTSAVGLPTNPVQETAGVGVGAVADAEAAGNGSVIAILKRIRTLLNGPLTVDGSGVTQPVSDAGGALSVDDNGGSLTTDSAQLPGALTAAGNFKVAVQETSLPAVIAKSHKIADADGAQTDAALTTVSAGTRIVLTRLTVAVDEACTVGVGVRIGLGTATIGAASLAGTTDIILEHAGIVPGGGITIGDGSGVLALGDSDEDLRITCDDPVGGALDVSYSYYTTT